MTREEAQKLIDTYVEARDWAGGGYVRNQKKANKEVDEAYEALIAALLKEKS